MKKVKCIDNHGATDLYVGQVYEVGQESISNYILIGIGGWKHKSRFEDVSDTVPDTVPTPHKSESIPEWRMFRDAGIASDECACGTKRAVCSYHRTSQDQSFQWVTR